MGLLLSVAVPSLLVWAMVAGLTRKDVEKPVVAETKIVEATPPPPPPPPTDLPPPPRMLPPPPVYVPPPPVDVPPPPTPSPVQAQTNLPPPAPPVPPAPPATVATPPAPPAPPAPHFVAKPAVVHSDDPSCLPQYPAAAARAGASGVTRLRFTIDASGKVTATDIIASSGPTREHRQMDSAAKNALATCPASPGLDESGKPTGTTVVVDYVWKLQD